MQLLKRVIFLLGGPGAGKGTMGKLLQQEFQWQHISAGSLLRRFVKTQTDEAKRVEKILVTGQIVPVKNIIQFFEKSRITIGLLRQNIKESKYNTFIIDGFPRNMENYQTWNQFNKNNDIKVITCVHLVCNKEILWKRIKKRDSNRSDDNEVTFKKRIKVYDTDTAEVLREFEKKQKLLNINGDGLIDDVYQVLKKELLKLAI